MALVKNKYPILEYVTVQEAVMSQARFAFIKVKTWTTDGFYR